MSAGIPIKTYSQLLLSRPSQTDFIIDSFEKLDELRGWYWEVYIEQNESHSLNELMSAIIDILTPICVELELSIVTD